MDKILAFFASLGYALEHFPANDEFPGAWQFDGGPGGVVIDFERGANGLGVDSTFGVLYGLNGNEMSLTMPVNDWPEYMFPSVEVLLLTGHHISNEAYCASLGIK